MPIMAAPHRARRPPVANRVLAGVLRSPLSSTVDGALVLLTLRGRRTGRDITLPVQYAAGADAIWIYPGRPDTKVWWRNLRTPAPVRIRLRGEDLPGCAAVVDPVAEPAVFTAGRDAYRRRFPHATPDLLVRVEVPDDALTRARTATVVSGRGPAGMVRRHPLAAYVLLSFGISWSYWIPVAFAGGHLSHFPGLLGPMLAALAITAVSTGRAGLADLARRMTRYRVPPRWYAASVVPLAAALAAWGGFAVTGRPLPPLREFAHMPGLPLVGLAGVVALTVLVNGYGEETGWRGYAWPRLRERHSLRDAALILTAVWALWHVPLFWLDTGMRGFPVLAVPGFLIGIAAGAVLLGWLYERSGSSLPVVVLWHTALNLASATTATAPVAAAASAVTIGWAVLVLRGAARRER